MENEINYLSAVGFMLIGWAVKVTSYYFKFDTNRKFNIKRWWRIYDKYIIFGFVGSIALAFISDIIWTFALAGMLGMEGVPYEERLNILLGLFIIPLLNKWEKTNNGKS